jgi:hypothetical protein
MVVWDGWSHVDLNLFTYSEHIQFAEKFEEDFVRQSSGLKRTLRERDEWRHTR